jgi:hypothetical protein
MEQGIADLIRNQEETPKPRKQQVFATYENPLQFVEDQETTSLD